MDTRQVIIEMLANMVMNSNANAYKTFYLPHLNPQETRLPFSEYGSNRCTVVNHMSDLIDEVVEKVKEIQK